MVANDHFGLTVFLCHEQVPVLYHLVFIGEKQVNDLHRFVEFLFFGHIDEYAILCACRVQCHEGIVFMIGVFPQVFLYQLGMFFQGLLKASEDDTVLLLDKSFSVRGVIKTIQHQQHMGVQRGNITAEHLLHIKFKFTWGETGSECGVKKWLEVDIFIVFILFGREPQPFEILNCLSSQFCEKRRVGREYLVVMLFEQR